MMPTIAPKEKKTQQQAVFPVLPIELRERILDPKDPLCPFHNYEGNEQAVRTALSLARKSFSACVPDAHRAGTWLCSREYPVRMLLTGPRSCGKTTFARNYAATVSKDWTDEGTEEELWLLPWVELDGTSLKKRDEILTACEMACRAKGLPLTPVKVVGGVRHYKLPPMVMFIDEVHGVPKVLLEGLLKMTELKDGILEIGVSVKVDCQAITIILGTTNPGALKDTMLSRFPVRLDLKQHSLDQVAKIIQNDFKWPQGECVRLAELKPLPREALAVAQLIEDTRISENITLRNAMDQWISNLNLREGLSDRATEILVSLAEAMPHGMSKENLCASLAIEKEEFQRQLLPQLLRTPAHPSYVTVSGRHKITQAGLEELRRLGYTDY